ncbi:MAG: hypothetical protein ABJB76_01045 [Candidatus Nitrosocosmicus sp.]
MSEGIIESSRGFYFLPTLRFDISGICQSMWFEHAFKHLIQDVGDFINRFIKLQENFNEYNKNLRSFGNDLEELIKSYFIENAFEIRDPSNNRHEINTVEIIYELTDVLKGHWQQKDKIQIYYQWDNNTLHIHTASGLLMFGIFSEDRQEDIINCLYDIRNYKPILDKFKNITDCLDKIITDEKNLLKDINENIIMKMQTGVYNTTCKDCENIYKNK